MSGIFISSPLKFSKTGGGAELLRVAGVYRAKAIKGGRMKPLVLIRKVSLLVLILAPAAAAGVHDLGEGSLHIRGGEARLLPLKHTAVRAEISGFVSEVSVTQVFVNRSTGPIEAVYVFPLPQNAAVTEMTLEAGGRKIKGAIKKRQEAREVYDNARAAGHTAALLEQERPDIFTQSVANIPPGGEIKVSLEYNQDLYYDKGVYTFVFPMTIGPRYIPGAPEGKTGTGWSPDTGAVPDASRITPPVVRPGMRSGRNISLEVKLNPGIAVKRVRSASHDIETADLGGGAHSVKLEHEDEIPNRDFLLTYEAAGKPVDAAVLAHKDGGDGYLTLTIQPSADFPLSQVTPKELVFALDVSGSMKGFPLELARTTVLKCLEGMNPDDTFQILTFSTESRLHFEKPLRNSPENVARARRLINGLASEGGTGMLDALRAALEFPRDPGRMRIVLFVTDGYIGNESQVLGFVGRHLKGSRVFPLGIGSAPNRYLLEELAAMGKGAAQYVTLGALTIAPEKSVELFYERISKPVLSDLSVDWKGLDVKEQSPAALGDLFAGQPLFLHARYGRGGEAEAVLKGKMRGKPWSMPFRVVLPEKETGNPALGPLWARSRIAELSRQAHFRAGGEEEKDITALALEHSLVTQYTSFVAVDESTSTAGEALLVPVESELPEGTQYEGFFGDAGAAAAGSGAAAGGGSGMLAAVRKSVSGLFSTGETVYSGGFGCRSDGYLADPAAYRPAAPARSRVAALSLEFLSHPSRRLARRLVATQKRDGVMTGDDGGAVTPADQALAVLALLKARRLYGPELDEALKLAWKYLRDRSHDGLDSKGALTAALNSGGHLKDPVVRAGFESLSDEVGKLK